MEPTEKSQSGLRPEGAGQDQATTVGLATAEPGPLKQAPGQDTEPRCATQTGSVALARDDATPEAQSVRGSKIARHMTPTRCRDSPPRPSTLLDSPFRRPPALLGPFTSSLQSPEVCKPPPLFLLQAIPAQRGSEISHCLCPSEVGVVCLIS